MAKSRSRFVWYELMTSDPAAATDFYCRVVGWTARDSGMPGMNYTLLHAGETGVGGLMAVPAEAAAAGARPGWLGYVSVPDVDAYAAKVRDAGGGIHHAPDDIPGVGRFAVVADPQGAALALYKGSSDEAPPAVAPGTPGHVGWNELQAVDGAAAFAFYSSLFGWTAAEAMDMGELGIYQLFATGEQPDGGMMTRVEKSIPPFWLFYVNVDAIDAAVQRIEAGGGRVIAGPQQVPGGSWIVNAVDPQGAVFALVAPKR